jgi:hypothetical protein
MGLLNPMTLLGSLFIRKQVVIKASPKKRRGTEEWVRRASLVSTICMCFLSTDPFC